MAQKVSPAQFDITINGTRYRNCYFQSGTAVIAVGAADQQDVAHTTAIPKFPNNLLAWSVAPGWVNATWDYIFRGGYVSQGATYLTVTGNWRSASAQNVEVEWWAIGN